MANLEKQSTGDGKNLGCKKTCKYRGKLPINWCRISSINSVFQTYQQLPAQVLFEPKENCVVWHPSPFSTPWKIQLYITILKGSSK